jgi:hypothetical protein
MYGYANIGSFLLTCLYKLGLFLHTFQKHKNCGVIQYFSLTIIPTVVILNLHLINILKVIFADFEGNRRGWFSQYFLCCYLFFQN